MSHLEAAEMRLARALGRRPNVRPGEWETLSPMAQKLYASLAQPKASVRRANRERPTGIYLLYDGSGTLLYVGLSLSIAQRMGQHSHEQPWWDTVARIDVEHLPSRDAAANRERELIAARAPLHNRNGGGA